MVRSTNITNQTERGGKGKLNYTRYPSAVVEGYVDNNEEGAIGWRRLNIRPKYQRIYYDEEKRNAVIDTIRKGFAQCNVLGKEWGWHFSLDGSKEQLFLPVCRR